MKKKSLKAQVDDDTITRLNKQGEAVGGQSANTLAAMILTEFSHVKPTSGAIWEALGRIHEEAASNNAAVEIEKGAVSLPQPRRGEIAVSR